MRVRPSAVWTERGERGRERERTRVLQPSPIRSCCEREGKSARRKGETAEGAYLRPILVLYDGERCQQKKQGEGRRGEKRTFLAFHSKSFSASSFAILNSVPPFLRTISETFSNAIKLTSSFKFPKRINTVGSSLKFSGKIFDRFSPLTLVPSRSSSDVGVRPVVRISTTDETASATVGKEVRATLSGTRGARRTVTFVMMPRVPSLPRKRRPVSHPVEDLPVRDEFVRREGGKGEGETNGLGCCPSS